MTKEEFCLILAAEGFTATEQEDLWRTRPQKEELTKEKLRLTCQRIKPKLSDIRVQDDLSRALAQNRERCQAE